MKSIIVVGAKNDRSWVFFVADSIDSLKAKTKEFIESRGSWPESFRTKEISKLNDFDWNELENNLLNNIETFTNIPGGLDVKICNI
jgi:hypothetical protein